VRNPILVYRKDISLSSYGPKGFYDEWYRIRADERSRQNVLIDRDIMAVEYVAAARNVLEIGCGTGTILDLLPAQRKCGIDISSMAINYTISKGIEGYVVDIDQDDLPFQDGEFDAVLCIEVLEHLFDPIHALAEANRVLIEGGRLVVTVPNVAYYQYRLLHLWGKFTDLHGNGLIVDEHIRFYTQDSMARIIELCGFTVQRTKGALKRVIPIPSHLQDQEKNDLLLRKLISSLSIPTKERFSAIKLFRTRPLFALDYAFNLWQTWPRLFAVGLVFECVKSTTPEYRHNPPVDHTKRTEAQRALNVNL
jgi:SAM-dependent methyltransferase